MGQKNIAIIGAGIGGMSAAARLADAGYNVHVFEKNREPGGKARVLRGGGFRFDKGPSLLTMPFVFDNFIKDLHESPEDYLRFDRLKINCQYFFPDQTVIKAYADKRLFSEEIASHTKDNGGCVIRFFNYCHRLYDRAADMFLFNTPLLALRRIDMKKWSTLVNINQLGMFTTLNNVNKHFFQDAKNVQLFNRYATYNGSSPFHAPATFLIIPHVEFTFGAYNVLDGIYSIPKALYSLAKKKGASFHFEKEVRGIIHEEHRIKGINLQDGTFCCDAVVANSDVRNTYNLLQLLCFIGV
jgi:phytoene dehydrogenase-like protein